MMEGIQRFEGYKLISSCFLVKGYTKSLIVDSQRQNVTFIPNVLSDFLDNIKPVSSLFTLNNEDQKIIEDILLELEDLELIFDTSYINFDNFNKEFDYPSVISNAILCINSESNYLIDAINQLSDLLCYFGEIRIEDDLSLKLLNDNLSLFEGSTFHSLNIIFKTFSPKIFNDILNLFRNFQRILEVTFFNTPEVIINEFEGKYIPKVHFRSENITHQNCGNIKKSYFSTSLDNYIESLHHNSCLNRKISIDAEGNIKNCPSMTESFGNIRDTTLAEAIEKPGFKKYWDINKDKIHVCKDCEFRYICTDCRAYVEDPEDILSKPLKCGYNPYTGEWSEWSTNPLKQKAIDFYGMREMVEDMQKSAGE